jgi:hypothetical protein
MIFDIKKENIKSESRISCDLKKNHQFTDMVKITSSHFTYKSGSGTYFRKNLHCSLNDFARALTKILLDSGDVVVQWQFCLEPVGGAQQRSFQPCNQ